MIILQSKAFIVYFVGIHNVLVLILYHGTVLAKPVYLFLNKGICFQVVDILLPENISITSTVLTPLLLFNVEVCF